MSRRQSGVPADDDGRLALGQRRPCRSRARSCRPSLSSAKNSSRPRCGAPAPPPFARPAAKTTGSPGWRRVGRRREPPRPRIPRFSRSAQSCRHVLDHVGVRLERQHAVVVAVPDSRRRPWRCRGSCPRWRPCRAGQTLFLGRGPKEADVDHVRRLRRRVVLVGLDRFHSSPEPASGFSSLTVEAVLGLEALDHPP